ncbi:hypothetical protein NHQ30_009887 [Ciborinia camelliae]|nr:hypothetical protein NHQ30_009887 [Ciborinia camelliae]
MFRRLRKALGLRRRISKATSPEDQSEIMKSTTQAEKRWLEETNWNTSNQIEFREFRDISCESITPGQLHELGTEEKNAIFKDFIAETDGQEESAWKLLKGLEMLAPDVAKNFELAPNLLENFTFRLVNDNVPKSYLAVSYCWSPAYQSSNGQKTILGESEEYPLPFDPVFFYSMFSEFTRRDEGLWIDQLCIDQNSQDEKGTAIPAMVAVYKNARKVIVLIDDVIVTREESDWFKWFIPLFEASSEIITITRPFSGESPPFMETMKHFQTFFEKICFSRWFTRAWCSHEMRLGPRHIFYVKCEGGSMPTVLCFTGEFLWYMLTLSLEILNPDVRLQNVQRTIGINFDIFKQVEKVREILGKQSEGKVDDASIADIQGSNTSGDGVDYTLHLKDIFALGAGGDPSLPERMRKCDANCDKISIVLNVAGKGLKLKRNHTPEALKRFEHLEECYRQMLIVALVAGDPMPLCALGPHLKLGASTSFLCYPDETDPGSSPKLPLSPVSEDVLSNISISPSPSTPWISLPLLRIPPKNRVDIPDIYLSTSRKIIRILTVFGFGLDPHSNICPGFEYHIWRPRSHRGIVLEEMWEKSVACVLYCGVNWMLDVAFKCGFPPNEREKAWRAAILGWFKQEGKENGFEELWGNGENSMKWMGNTEGLKAVNAVLKFTNWMLSWGYARPGKKWKPNVWRWGEDGKMIVFSEEEPEIIAVPSCLLSDGYERLARGWVLSPREGGEKEYVMMYKTRFFINLSIENEEESGWEKVENSKVYGPQ